MRTTLSMLIASLALSTTAGELAQRTLLDDYVDQTDDSYAWQIGRSPRQRMSKAPASAWSTWCPSTGSPTLKSIARNGATGFACPFRPRS